MVLRTMISASFASLVLSGLAVTSAWAKPQPLSPRLGPGLLSRDTESAPSPSGDVPNELDWSTVRSVLHALKRCSPESQLKPTTDLKNMTDCFDGFQCGRLLVPLDHTDKNGAKATIAVQVYPATERDPSKYKGIIMFNPVC